MNRNELLKNFAIGFIPIFVFIIADEIFGTKIGLVVAITVGVFYLIYYLLRYRRLEKFILFDTILIVILGGVSIILQDEIFFKLKPALIELIVVIVLAIHAFSSKPILLTMSKRYMGDVDFGSEQALLMRQLSRILFFVFLLHTLLITYSAYYWSKEAWAFISGGLFYILMGIILAGQWIYLKFFKKNLISKRSTQTPKEEWFDLVNEQGKVIGKAPRSTVHGNPEKIHQTVHVHIFNENGQLYLQKRSEKKDLYPGKWDTAVGGHVASGESIEDALYREAEEELGLQVQNAKPMYKYIMRNSWESELIHAFELVHEGPFELNPEEIEKGRFWSSFEIQKLLGQEIFTPNFEQEFEFLKKMKKM